MQCPRCAAALPDDDLFCETCGARLGPAPPASSAVCSCGAPESEIDEDGFCSRCGHRARRPATDRIETSLSPICAAVSDRGLKHDRNEDRFGIHQAGSGYAFVVCDGVSSSRESQLASSAVAALVSDSLVADGDATVVVEGDSRAYWIVPGGAQQLTSDHSWMNAVVSAGEMTAEEAEKAPQAHAITRWLGADAGENAAADTARFPVTAPGVLLLCTDGLWNYAATPEAMAQIVHEANGHGGDALAVARNLIAFAIAQGGHDNITAIVLRCGTANKD
jgi:serine/threonine protein phosphatase PrpC